MISEVRNYYGITKEFYNVGYFESENNAYLTKEIKSLIPLGRLIALSGIVGSGKTTLIRNLQNEMRLEKKIVIAKSLSVDKDKINLNTLITALFYDLATEKNFKIPHQPEKRERKLCELIQKSNKPVCLFIDESHDIHSKTLSGLKRLIEVVQDYDGVLSIVLIGHPKLKNDLRKPAIEEVGARTEIFVLEGISNQKIEYIEWLLKKCLKSNAKTKDVIHENAINLLADRLATPLQIQHYLGLAFQEGHKIGQKIISSEVIESILSYSLNNIEAKLSRNGYNVKSLAGILNLRSSEIKSFLNGQLSPNRTEEVRQQIFSAGIAL